MCCKVNIVSTTFTWQPGNYMTVFYSFMLCCLVTRLLTKYLAIFHFLMLTTTEITEFWNAINYICITSFFSVLYQRTYKAWNSNVVHVVQVSLLLTWNRFHILLGCLHYWLCTCKYRLAISNERGTNKSFNSFYSHLQNYWIKHIKVFLVRRSNFKDALNAITDLNFINVIIIIMTA